MISSSKSILLITLFFIKCLKWIRSITNIMKYAKQSLMIRRNWKISHLINALLRTIFFITKIVYKYLNQYTSLLFKKYTINLYIIIQKSLVYINYSNENIIKKVWKQQSLYMSAIITFAKKSKLLNIVNMIYYNYFQFHKNVNKTFL